MGNTSATGGYLTPADPALPQEDAELDALFQKAVVGITGLQGKYVRPLWQPNPPKQPEPSVSWAAISVTQIIPDASPFIEHDPTGQGSENLTRHEDIEVFCTFYGPQAQRNAALLRDGVGLPQNIEALASQQIKFVDAGEVRPAPDLVNQQWVKRYDLKLRFRRKVTRSYGVLNIVSANPILISDEIGVVTP